MRLGILNAYGCCLWSNPSSVAVHRVMPAFLKTLTDGTTTFRQVDHQLLAIVVALLAQTQ